MPDCKLEVSTKVLDIPCEKEGEGVVIVKACGGVEPYVYSIGIGEQEEDTFTDLSSGTYTVTVTDADGCIQEQEVIIEEPMKCCSHRQADCIISPKEELRLQYRRGLSLTEILGKLGDFILKLLDRTRDLESEESAVRNKVQKGVEVTDSFDSEDLKTISVEDGIIKTIV